MRAPYNSFAEVVTYWSVHDCKSLAKVILTNPFISIGVWHILAHQLYGSVRFTLGEHRQKNNNFTLSSDRERDDGQPSAVVLPSLRHNICQHYSQHWGRSRYDGCLLLGGWRLSGTKEQSSERSVIRWFRSNEAHDPTCEQMGAEEDILAMSCVVFSCDWCAPL